MVTQINFATKQFAACMLAAPMLGFIASFFWVTNSYSGIWPNIYWISFMLFMPVAFMLGQTLKTKTPGLASVATILSLVGCVACAGHMFLFRFNAVYPYHGKRNFADVFMNVIDKDFIALLTYIPALLFPVSFVLFGIAALLTGIFNKVVGLLLIAFGILFWMGNAGESDMALLSCYIIGVIASGLLIAYINQPAKANI